MIPKIPIMLSSSTSLYYLVLFINCVYFIVNSDGLTKYIGHRRLFDILRPIPKQCIFKGFLKRKQRKTPSYRSRRKERKNYFDYEDYHSFEEITVELDHRSLNSDRMDVEKLGKTFENRHILAAKILGTESQLEGFEGQNPLIVIDCGTHAREWITHATCMYIINKLVENKDEISKKMLTGFDWTVIPVLNPDGYVYTWGGGNKTLWRKNRAKNYVKSVTGNEKQSGLCIGVDINRNFGTHWGEIGATSKPCFEMFAGQRPFSEKESSSLAKYLKKEQNRLVGYVSLHTYGQSWNTPFGFRKKLPKDYKEQLRVALKAVDAIKRTNDMKFVAGASYETIYPNSGSSTDWVYDALGVVHSYLVEMIGCGFSHFHLPPENIAFNAKGIYAAFGVMTEEIQKYFNGTVN